MGWVEGQCLAWPLLFTRYRGFTQAEEAQPTLERSEPLTPASCSHVPYSPQELSAHEVTTKLLSVGQLLDLPEV